MIKFAALLRRILLSITTVLGLILCVFRASPITSLGSFLVYGILGGGTLYVIVSLISLLVRLIRRKQMDESDQMKDSFLAAITYRKNGYTINFFRRLSFWGTIMMVVNFAACNVTTSMIFSGPYVSSAFISGYHGFLLWSFVGLLFFIILSLLFWAFYLPHYGDGAYNIFQYTGKLLVADITTPIRILKSFFRKDKDGSKSKGGPIGFVFMIIFIVVNAIAIILQK